MNNEPTPTPADAAGVTVAVIEADALIRSGLVATLEGAGLGVAATSAAVEELPDHRRFDVFVLALSHEPDVTAQAIEALEAPGIVLADELTDVELVDVLRAGAQGLMHKRVATRMLAIAVLAVTRGGVFLEPRVVDRLLASIGRGLRGTGPHGLTAQERRVLTLLPGNPTNREIAEQLGITVDTVKTHLRNGIRKLEAYDRFDAARMVEEYGIDNL